MTGATEPQRVARRSDVTRAAILAAARARFAADGYEKATIRAIARDARIDPSMVMRYYGNKADLFGAAVAMDPGLPDLPVESREVIGRTLVRHFLTLWEENGELTALLRVGATEPAAAERMQSVLRDQLIPLARQVGPEPEQAPTRAALCASTVLGLALTRYVLRFPASVALDPEEIVDWLGPTMQRYLTAPTP
ncbi:TetR family transcriptional regulator [Streptomyces sp. 3MP-14]|uniref:TetR family transcriptional regulator n=1 Tax=Streptomyces mimosae TaxID=2586635 RepID=A0A5N6A7D5_9ACTN|nr:MULTISPECIES: TetR family transcriptional regulator [Streptomyces]KAB8163358.1 TetR family transcriptional regulator [Streptomyces mimosae]KAB8174635.1 TetR family transcriptional regulator [Streptomyces sp. 3MP-14]